MKTILKVQYTRSSPTLESLRLPRSKTTEHVGTFLSEAGARNVSNQEDWESPIECVLNSARHACLPLTTSSLAKMGLQYAVLMLKAAETKWV